MLEGRGVDLFMVETFFDLDDLETAVAAVRSVSQPADRRAHDVRRRPARRSPASRAPRRRARGSRALGVAAFGANHGAGPAAALAGARGDADGAARRSPRCRTSASRACPGSASSSRTRRPRTSASSPRRRARSARGIIGGCCGTTPAQIAAIRAAVDENVTPAAPLLVRERERGRAGRRRPTSRRSLQRLLDDGRRSSSRCSSTRRSARTPRRCSRPRARCASPARRSSST